MSSSTSRVAQLRRKRRDQGLKETNVWLGPDDEAAIEKLQRRGLKTRSEVIQYALRQASNQEQKVD